MHNSVACCALAKVGLHGCTCQQEQLSFLSLNLSVRLTSCLSICFPQVPIAVRDKRAHPRGDGWRIVTWIDSKATFGDDRTHSKQYEEQYSTCAGTSGSLCWKPAIGYFILCFAMCSPDSSLSIHLLCSYVNRYGPGLIIYWFDFIEDLDSDAGKQADTSG